MPEASSQPERTAEILRGVEALLSHPNRWTKHALARDAAGHALGDYDEDYVNIDKAVCWCLEGACWAVGMKNSEWNGVLRALGAVIDGSPVTCTPFRFNDAPDTEHADVLRIVREARRRLEEGVDD